MKNYRLFLILFITFLLSSSQCYTYAQNEYFFRQISLKDGLPRSSVRCTHRDSKGYIWIGTNAGLSRYNSDKLETYRQDANDENSLPGEFINFITEDKIGTVWIGTNKGLVRYDQIADNFHKPSTLDRGFAMKTYLHTDDGVLFAEGSKLCRYDYDSSRFTVLHIEGDSNLASIISLHHWIGGKILIGTRLDGLFIYDTQKSRIERADFYTGKNISAYFVDDHKNLWLSPYGEGLLCYNYRGEMIGRYNTRNSKIGYDIILDIESRNNSIWLATDGGGISIFNTEDESFSNIVNSPADKTSLPENSIQSLYKDGYNNIWAGSIRSGLIWIKSVFIKSYSDVSLGNEQGLSYKTAISILEDKDYGIWIGTDGGGLNLYDPKSKHFKHYKSTYGDKITDIENLSAQELVITKYGQGIFTLNKQSGRVSPLLKRNSPKLQSINRLNTAILIKRIEGDNFLVAADSIYVLNRKTERFKVADYTNIDKLSSAKEYIDRDGNIIYLHDNRYILSYDYQSNSLRAIYTHNASQGAINSVYFDHTSSTFWIGSTNGVVSYNMLSGKIERPLDEQEWFKDYSIASLTIDKKRRLWIGARRLYSFGIESHILTEYGERDGVATNEFIARTTLVSQNGNIYLGGTMGLMRIESDIKPQNERASSAKMALNEITVDGISAMSRVIQDETGSHLTIPHNHNTIKIKTIYRKEDIFHSDVEKYFINGVPTYESNHVIDLLYLSPNTYDISASTRDSYGEWSEPEHIISICVTPPWWSTVWATTIFVLAVILIAAAIAAVTYSRRRKRLRLLIAEQKFKITENKINFMTNISHELRTSITLIYAPLKRMLKEKEYDPSFKQPLMKVYNQSKKVSNIINMILDSQKMEYSFQTLNLSKQNLNEWLKECTYEFSDEYSERNIKMQLQLDSAIEEVVFDRQKFDIAVSNYLINALKYNRPDTTLTIKSELIDESIVRISVTDQGVGIDQDEMANLFTRFYKGNHDIIGTGIGLSYVKSLLEMHNGDVGAYNNADGNGATFYMEFNTAELEGIFLSQQHEKLAKIIDQKIELSQEIEPSQTDTDTSTYSILVADDNDELRQYISETLSPKFKKIFQAHNGREALDIINREMPDVVISDVMMPEMDGYELCLALKSNIDISHIPIILLSSNKEHNKKYIGYKMGADRYIEKPFDIDMLEIAISNLIKARINLKERYNSVSPLSNINPIQSTFSSADERFMTKLDEFIESNIDNTELNTNLIVKELYISRTSLYNKLNSIVGLGVNEYINRARVNRAATLLTTTDEPIQNIADMVGFNTQRYFSTVFKALTNQSPSEYRKQKTGVTEAE